MSAELYLRDHSELTALLTDFTTATLQAQPADVVQFAVQFFSSIRPAHTSSAPAAQRPASPQPASNPSPQPSSSSDAQPTGTAIAQH